MDTSRELWCCEIYRILYRNYLWGEVPIIPKNKHASTNWLQSGCGQGFHKFSCETLLLFPSSSESTPSPSLLEFEAKLSWSDSNLQAHIANSAANYGSTMPISSSMPVSEDLPVSEPRFLCSKWRKEQVGLIYNHSFITQILHILLSLSCTIPS